MTEPALLKSEADGILELMFNRPEKLNALNNELLTRFEQAVFEFRDRPELRVMLIRSQGRYFSAGADLTENRTSDTQRDSPIEARRNIRTGLFQRIWEEMEKIEKPFVVANHAVCVGGSLEMSLSCDFRLAAKSASYWFPEMQLGMAPLSGGISRLTRLCGPHWARWMLIANEKVQADRALIMGLVHEVYPDETFEADVRAFCKRLASYPAEVVAATKTAIDLCADLDSDSARQVERLAYSGLAMTRESREISAKFRAKLTSPKPKT